MIEVVSSYSKAKQIVDSNSLIVVPCDYRDKPDEDSNIFRFPIAVRVSDLVLHPIKSDDLIRESAALESLVELVNHYYQGKRIIFCNSVSQHLLSHLGSTKDINSFYTTMKKTLLTVFGITIGYSYFLPECVSIELKSNAVRHLFRISTNNMLGSAYIYDKAVADYGYIDTIDLRAVESYEGMDNCTIVSEMVLIYGLLVDSFFLGKEI